MSIIEDTRGSASRHVQHTHGAIAAAGGDERPTRGAAHAEDARVVVQIIGLRRPQRAERIRVNRCWLRIVADIFSGGARGRAVGRVLALVVGRRAADGHPAESDGERLELLALTRCPRRCH